jgi:sugar-specific transcriptional regulator TrmB
MKIEEVLNILQESGLSEYESKCYFALFQHKKLTAGECAKLSKIPPTKVHETLYSLAEKGLINIFEGKPKIFSLAPIEQGLENFFRIKENKIDFLRKLLMEKLKSVKIEEPGKIEEKVRVVYGIENQQEISISMNETAKKEILVLTGVTAGFTPHKLFHVARIAVKRGVKIRMIQTKIKNREKDIDKYKEMGYRVRYLDLGGLFLVIKDREESLIVLVDPKDESKRIAIHILQKELAEAHAKYFDEMWKRAREV